MWACPDGPGFLGMESRYCPVYVTLMCPVNHRGQACWFPRAVDAVPSQWAGGVMADLPGAQLPV